VIAPEQRSGPAFRHCPLERRGEKWWLAVLGANRVTLILMIVLLPHMCKMLHAPTSESARFGRQGVSVSIGCLVVSTRKPSDNDGSDKLST